MTAVAPWTVLDSAVSFADPWLRIRSDRVRTAGGDVFGPFHVVEYPDRVTIVPFVQGSFRLLLVRAYRHGVGAVLSGLPGGIVERTGGSSPLEASRSAAERELREETGYDGGSLEHLTTLLPNPSNQSNTAYCYLSTGLSRTGLPQKGEAGEAQEVIEADLLEVLAMLRKGTLALHAIHTAALWSAAARITGDQSDRFGPLTMGVRRFFSGQDSSISDLIPITAVSRDRTEFGHQFTGRTAGVGE